MHKCSLDASLHPVKLPRMALPTMMCQDICPLRCIFIRSLPKLVVVVKALVSCAARDKCPLSHRRPHCYNHPCDGGHFPPRSARATPDFHIFHFFAAFVSPCVFFTLFAVPSLFPSVLCRRSFSGTHFFPSLGAPTYTFPTGSLRRSNITKLWTSL